MYDFMVFGYYATAIGKAFFPTGSAFLSLMLSLMTFGAGFLMRPLGAIVLGAYADRHGRRAGLLLTLTLMSIGIVSIACTPGYASIGLIAPLVVLCGRLLQGFSAGMELGGVSVYLSEIATPGHKGFYVSWQSGSQQVAVMFAALVGVLLGRALQQEQMAASCISPRSTVCWSRSASGHRICSGCRSWAPCPIESVAGPYSLLARH
jgi:MFS family permease